VTLNFPPQPTHEHEIEMLLKTLASVIDGRTAVYLSAPITSGKRFADWQAQQNEAFNMAQSTSQDEHRREVIKANRTHAQSLARELRRVWSRVLIDPTAVADLPGWTQDDYRHLWARVIERYADTVVFIDGWQYSNGCAYEFLIAQRSGAKTLSEDQHPLTLEAGEQLIRAAINELRTQALSPIFLQQVVEELAKMGDKNTKGHHAK